MAQTNEEQMIDDTGGSALMVIKTVLTSVVIPVPPAEKVVLKFKNLFANNC